MAVQRKHYDVTPEQFVVTWSSSQSGDEVSRKLGMPLTIVHARASQYRKHGVKLKKK